MRFSSLSEMPGTADAGFQGRLYLDANVFVYGIEDAEPWGKAVREIFEAIDLGACTAPSSTPGPFAAHSAAANYKS